MLKAVILHTYRLPCNLFEHAMREEITVKIPILCLRRALTASCSAEGGIDLHCLDAMYTTFKLQQPGLESRVGKNTGPSLGDVFEGLLERPALTLH